MTFLSNSHFLPLLRAKVNCCIVFNDNLIYLERCPWQKLKKLWYKPHFMERYSNIWHTYSTSSHYRYILWYTQTTHQSKRKNQIIVLGDRRHAFKIILGEKHYSVLIGKCIVYVCIFKHKHCFLILTREVNWKTILNEKTE